jgi:hypothetical protein
MINVLPDKFKAKMTDKTKVAKTPWKDLKERVMEEDFRSSAWFEALNRADKYHIESLRTA